LLAEQGQLDAALEQMQRAIEMEPKYPPLRLSCANVLIRRGEYESAKKQLAVAVKLNKRYWDAWQRLAELCALAPVDELRDGDFAAKISGGLVRDTPRKNPRDLEILAAALAEQASFAKAAEIASRLVQQYQQRGDTIRARIMQKRQLAYAAGRTLYWVDGETGN
jgi:tetratricopeptide (TPR) repeat protein